jgi:hypothetical protein
MFRLPLMVCLLSMLGSSALRAAAEGGACCARPATRNAMLTGKPGAPATKAAPIRAWLVPISTVLAGELGKRVAGFWLMR